MSLITLVPKEEKPRIPNKGVIDLLENLLELAKTSDMNGCVIVHTYEDGCSGNCFYVESPILTLGEMRAVEREILDLEVEGRLHSAGDPY